MRCVFCGSPCFISLLSQSRWSCGGRCAVTRTRCGVWSTARPTTASSPARLTERSGCGTPPTPRRLSLFSTREEVSKTALTDRLSVGSGSLVHLSTVSHLMTLCCLCVSELGVPTSVDLVSSEPAHMVTSFTTGHIGLFNMETQQLVLKLESAGPPGKSTDQSQIHTEVTSARVMIKICRMTQTIRSDDRILIPSLFLSSDC